MTLQLRKRKIPEFEDVRDVSAHVKRRRQRPIETGFASLSLDRMGHAHSLSPVSPVYNSTPTTPITTNTTSHFQPPVTSFIDPALAPPLPSPSAPLISHSIPTLPMPSLSVPSSVNLLASPPHPDIEAVPDTPMKTSSWYEPEPDRIVILDLDSSSESGSDIDIESSHPQGPQSRTQLSQSELNFHLSQALLNRLKQPPLSTSSSKPPTSPEDGMQLVLFRPPVWPVPVAATPTLRRKPRFRTTTVLEEINTPVPRSLGVDQASMFMSHSDLDSAAEDVDVSMDLDP